jgi:hypothetical protein
MAFIVKRDAGRLIIKKNTTFKIPKTAPDITYANGLYGKRYVGYFADDVSWFNTAALHGNVNQLTQINSFTSSADLYSWQWLGYFKASSTESYTFYTSSDDSSLLWVGNNATSGFSLSNLTVDNRGLHGNQERSSSPVSLVAGTYYPIRLQFGENAGGDVVTLNFSTATIPKTTNGLGYYYYNSITNGF